MAITDGLKLVLFYLSMVYLSVSSPKARGEYPKVVVSNETDEYTYITDELNPILLTDFRQTIGEGISAHQRELNLRQPATISIPNEM